MKNKFSRIVSLVLILAFLVSSLAVFVYADNGTAASGSKAADTDDIVLLVNRTYHEGWNYANGFTTKANGNNFLVEYEETDNYDYNYYLRVSASGDSAGYMIMDYGADKAVYGHSIVEFDIKTDDLSKIGTIMEFTSQVGSKVHTYPVLSVLDGKLGTLNDNLNSNGVVQYNISSNPVDIEDTWHKVAAVFYVNQRVCPACGTIHSITGAMLESDIICCKGNDADGNPLGGVALGQMDALMTVRVYFGNSETFDYDNAVDAETVEVLDPTKTYYNEVRLDDRTELNLVRIGLPGGTNQTGHGYLLDNVKFYHGSEKPVDVSKLGYGKRVNEAAAKTEEILIPGAEKTVLQYINSGLVMKVGVDKCLNAGTKSNIFSNENGVAYGAPVKIDGTVYVPLQTVLDWIGYPMFEHEDGRSYDISTENGSTFITIGRTTATADGVVIELSAAPGIATDKVTGEEYVVVAIDDISKLFNGYFVTYDDMGLIVVSTGENLLDRETDLDVMLDIMRDLVFDYKTGEDFYETVKANTNNFTHPYLVADQTQFDLLNEAYMSETADANLKGYIASMLEDAEEVYAQYVAEDVTTGKYLKGAIVNPHVLTKEQEDAGVKGNNGYSTKTGRLDEAVEHNENIRTLALAYQITREDRYARLAYEMALSMGEWTHWGPAHFVNCADATSAYALAYDWLYNIWKDLGYNVELIEAELFSNGVHMGYLASGNGAFETKYSRNQGDDFDYASKTNSWNVAGTSGMAIASLALLGSEYIFNINNPSDDEENSITVYTQYVTEAKWLLENNLKSLTKIGLDMYAPDGSYFDSPSAWSYATEKLVLLSWALSTSVGNDLGIINTWGIDKTFYFALQTEYASAIFEKVPSGPYNEINHLVGYEYKYWMFNDSIGDVLDTSMLFYAASALEDYDLAAIRIKQAATKKISLWDVLGYNVEYADLDPDSVELALDYEFENCDGVISRSDWSGDGIFVGIMGNQNGGETGHIDAGNFVYANKGILWFGDFGSEDPDVYGYNSEEHRYGYYRVTAEGSNVVIVTSNTLAMPNGQSITGSGTITDYYTSEYGMYTIVDNTNAYSGNIIRALRGVLFTNDRNTVVLQDEISYLRPQSYVWVANTPLSSAFINVSDEDGGKTATLTQEIDGVYYKLRLSIVSSSGNLSFEVVDAYKFLMNSTHGSGYATTQGMNPELDRSGYQRLIIRCNDSTQFNCAVVMELLTSETLDAEVQYEYTEIVDWNEDTVTKTFVPTVVNTDRIGNSDITDIQNYGAKMRQLLANKTIDEGLSYAFYSQFNDFYRSMVLVAAAVCTFKPSGKVDGTDAIREVREAYYNYLDDLQLYNNFRNEINSYMTEFNDMSIYLCGYN
ncbi:MAG: hypothetical protein E7617_01955 [Ruminococcaceae bacterium]|nr:hypothetical protein [Oscillospiraceae bacterium]